METRQALAVRLNLRRTSEVRRRFGQFLIRVDSRGFAVPTPPGAGAGVGAIHE